MKFVYFALCLICMSNASSNERNQLLRTVLSELLCRATADIPSLRHEVNHALNVVEWLDRLAPSASPALAVAALLHDCERWLPGQRIHKHDVPDYLEYKRQHSQQSANLASDILQTVHRLDLRADVVRLIERHEFGGDPGSDLLRDCDSLSFFSWNLPDYVEEQGVVAARKKIAFMYERMSPSAQAMVRSTPLSSKYLPVMAEFLRQH